MPTMLTLAIMLKKNLSGQETGLLEGDLDSAADEAPLIKAVVRKCSAVSEVPARPRIPLVQTIEVSSHLS